MTDVDTDDDASRMTLVEHLTELRGRLIKSFAAILVGAVVCWIFYPEILDFLLEPYCETRPTDDRVSSGLFGSEGSCDLWSQIPWSPSVFALPWPAMEAWRLPCRCCCGKCGAS